VKLLQALAVSFPDWEITMRVDVRGKESVRPPMGLIIHDDGIIDDLKREYLPDEFSNIVYEGTKRPKIGG
jgi:hypothetical protein